MIRSVGLCTKEEILDPIFILFCYHTENMGVKVRNSDVIAVLHYTVSVGIISYLVIYITEQKHIMKSLKLLQSRYG